MNFKKSIYKYHKQIGSIIMIPVFMWVISGLMHPITANWFRPTIAKTYIKPSPIDTEKALISLHKAAKINAIKSFKNANLVTAFNSVFYQFHLANDSLVYVNAATGSSSKYFDQEYAENLGRQCIEDDSSKVISFEKITEFNTEYREINRLLPVWKISFDREDGMDLYIHTSSSRLGTFNTTYRKWHIRIFDWLHNWGFIPGPPVLRIFIVGILSAFILIVALLGLSIYGFNWKKFKKMNSDASAHLRKRKVHRKIGILFSIFMILFSFSGSYHVWVKLEPDDRMSYFDDSNIHQKEIASDSIQIPNLPALINFSLHKIDKEVYYRTIQVNEGRKKVKFLNASTGIELSNGDDAYAKYLAKKFSGLNEVTNVQPIFKFEGEYGFVNKRLPVKRVDLKSENNETYYIETRTGKLAAKVNDSSRREGYSFAILHKFHFLDGLGKSTRDLFAALAALSLIIVALLGWRIKK